MNLDCTVSSHVLDAVSGRPAESLRITLFRLDDGIAKPIHSASTNADGRVSDWHTGQGPHRLRFETGSWFAAKGVEAFYPEVDIAFSVAEGHYHVPLLLSPFAYSTYRGS
ncbi:MAG TPA: hydroxyisourate hydrolase [Glycomyces sp.]|nr:hydroxyisourate hydrolase [Glycomyces sp.]